MKELFRRLLRHPLLAFEIITATFFIAVFNLAMPLFVMNIINRYVSHGFDGTLITLTTGMLIAVSLQYGFRISRTRMMGPLSAEPDARLSKKVLEFLVRARTGPLERLSNTRIQENLNGLQTIQTAYDIPGLTAVLDAPFSLLYILVAFFLSPFLALIAFIGILCALGSGTLSLVLTKKTAESLQEISMAHRGQVSGIIHSRDTVRAFEGKHFLSRIWENQIGKITSLRLKLANRKERSQSFILTTGLFMSVLLYAAGAVFVVRGDMTVGALIGTNILASRAYQNVVRFVQTVYQLYRAKEAYKKLDEFMGLPLEADKGTVVREYRGGIQFRDVVFAYPRSTGPLFESLDLKLEPGNVLVVVGRNGTGKTTLARLIVGLLMTTRGDILVDGISLRQIAPGWWRKQIIYYPQEPSFINGTIRENITLIHSGSQGENIDESKLNGIIETADLKHFLDTTPAGLETRIAENARHLSLGIRRRITLARALATNGRIAVFDEPTEGLDVDGCEAVFGILNQMVKSGRTIIAFSNDPLIAKGAHYTLDLNEKPVPKLTTHAQAQRPGT